MQTVELTSQKRELSTKGALRLVRVGGRVPAVVYGGKKGPAVASVDAKEFVKMIRAHGKNVLVNLKTDEGTELALVHDLQRDLITREPIHVDFRRISMTETLEVSVPVRIKGEAPGVKLQGGILEVILHDLRVESLPSDIPTTIDIDVSHLNINQGMKVKDIPLAKGIKVVTDGERLVLNVVAPTEFKEETPAAGAAVPGAAGAEPEVIAKGKKPEEGAEGAAAAPAGKDAKAAAPAAGAKDAKAAPAAPAKK